MIQRCTSVLFLLGFITLLSAQQQKDFNLTLVGLGQLDDVGSGTSQRYTDVWGWVSKDSTEYGIIGSLEGTSIFSLADPSNPFLVKTVPGAFSQWRDIKSHEDYLYVVADQGADGLLIIDMTEAPDSISWKFWKPDLIVHNEMMTLSTCHNLYIDSGLIFLAGCNGGSSRGVIILDISNDPMNPEYVSATDQIYAHDVFALDDRLYASNLSSGFSVIDISDPSQPETKAFQETSRNFTHNAWSSDDNQYLYTTDERSNAYVDAYQVNDLDNIRLLDKYQPFASRGLGTIPHNVHFHNDYLIISYYTDGIKVVDAHDPSNLIEVGSYDTYFDRDGTFGGAWGAYPFLPSGLVLGSDRSTGLYVFQPQYVRAAYLRGQVTDSITGDLLSGVGVTFISDLPGSDVTDGTGAYATGLGAEGLQSIEFALEGYEVKRLDVNLVSGITDTLNVSLRPLTLYQVAGQVIDEMTGEPIPGAKVQIQNSQYVVNIGADSTGQFTLTSYEGDFVLAAGQWGYVHRAETLNIKGDIDDISIRLNQGYRDDFAFEYGWQVLSSASVPQSQQWQRGVPGYAIYNGEHANPNGDIDGDYGKSCYVTGLDANLGSNLSDTSVLISPLFDLSDYTDPFVNYYLWFFDEGVNPPDDGLDIYICRGSEEILIERVVDSFSGWRDRTELRIADYLQPADSMYLKVFASDTGRVHIYKAAIDGFSITEGQTTATERPEQLLSIRAYPNPFQHTLTLDTRDHLVSRYEVTDIQGRIVKTGEIYDPLQQINLSAIQPGFYFLNIFNQQGLFSVKKLIKSE